MDTNDMKPMAIIKGIVAATAVVLLASMATVVYIIFHRPRRAGCSAAPTAAARHILRGRHRDAHGSTRSTA